MAIHFGQFGGFEQKVRLVGPSGLAVGIVLDSGIGHFQSAHDALMDGVKVFLGGLLVSDVGLAAFGRGLLYIGQLSYLVGAIPILASEDRIGLGTLLRSLVGIICPL